MISPPINLNIDLLAEMSFYVKLKWVIKGRCKVDQIVNPFGVPGSLYVVKVRLLYRKSQVRVLFLQNRILDLTNFIVSSRLVYNILLRLSVSLYGMFGQKIIPKYDRQHENNTERSLIKSEIRSGSEETNLEVTIFYYILCWAGRRKVSAFSPEFKYAIIRMYVDLLHAAVSHSHTRDWRKRLPLRAANSWNSKWHQHVWAVTSATTHNAQYFP